MTRRIQKLFLCTVLLAGLSSAANAYPDNKDSKNIGVSIEPLRLFLGSLVLEGEFKLLDFLSLTVPVVFLDSDWSTVTGGTNPLGDHWIIGTGLGLKFQATGKALSHGFYFNPNIGAGIGARISTKRTVGVITYGVQAGYMWVADCGVSVNPFVAVTQAMYLEKGASAFFGTNQVPISAGLKIGYAF